MDEEIEKKLFVEDNQKENIADIVDIFVKIGKITFEGKTLITPELIGKLNRKEIVGVQIAGKMLASMVKENINPEVTLRELEDWNRPMIPADQIMARINDLIKERIIVRLKRGVFQANNYYLSFFIKGIIEKYKP